MNEEIKQLEDLLERVHTAMGRLGIDDDQTKLAELEKEMAAPDFWANQERASQTSQQAASLRRHVESWTDLSGRIKETLELARLGDAALLDEIKASAGRLAAEYGEREFELKLSGLYDKNSAILSVYAGTGGTDAQDWAQMLLRMYLRWAEGKGYEAKVLDQSPGEEAGIKSATIEIIGQYAFGRLRSEKGVHRLVRLSPFNADNLRQTSFALVEVLPQIEGPGEIELEPSELKIDTYRAGGHGGQSVNTTDSAVRVTHVPTGLSAAIQNERSQLQNKEKAMAVLRARLASLMAEQHKDKLSEIRVETGSVQWGSQIRSYVLHPYTMVKDHRTGAETSQAEAVLEGAIDPFIESYLEKQIGQE